MLEKVWYTNIRVTSPIPEEDKKQILEDISEYFYFKDNDERILMFYEDEDYRLEYSTIWKLYKLEEFVKERFPGTEFNVTSYEDEE